jgi:hypothetical protein
MNINRLAVSVALGLLVASANSSAEAKKDKDLIYTGSFSGSVISTEYDPNGDGAKTGLVMGGRLSSLGSATVQGGTGDFVFAGSATCPNGHAGSQFTLAPTTGGNVTRFDSTGDLLITELTAATICIDPALPGMRFFSQTETVRGGTGLFEGATGSNTAIGTAQVLNANAAGDFFNSFTATFKGKITLKP